MELSLNAIVIAQSSDEANELMRVLQPEFALPECDFTTSVHKAVQIFSEMDFQTCFIGEHVTAEELTVFFRDLDKINKRSSCIFVQVRKSVPANLVRDSLKDSGIAAIISWAGSSVDKEALKKAFDHYYHREEVKRRSYNVDKATDLLLKEIDRMARERRRGQKKEFSHVVQGFIEDQATFAEELVEKYFEKLTERVSEAKPEESLTVEVPKKLLSKGLPCLKEDGYEGVSHRVWEKLLKNHGKKDGLAEKANLGPVIPDTTEPEPEPK